MPPKVRSKSPLDLKSRDPPSAGPCQTAFPNVIDADDEHMVPWPPFKLLATPQHNTMQSMLSAQPHDNSHRTGAHLALGSKYSSVPKASSCHEDRATVCLDSRKASRRCSHFSLKYTCYHFILLLIGRVRAHSPQGQDSPQKRIKLDAPPDPSPGL